MIRPVFRGVVRLLGALVAGFFVVVAFSAWRLSSGPVTLDFLTPTLESALAPEDGSFSVDIDTTVLTWEGWDQPLDLRARGAHAVAADGTPIATFPEVRLGLSARALLRGVVAPTRIDIVQPRLRLFRSEDGALEIVREGGGRPTEGDLFARLIAGLMTRPDGGGVAGSLRRATMIDADVVLEDRRANIVWRAPKSTIALARTANGLEGRMRLTLTASGSGVADTLALTASFGFETARRLLSVETVFAGVELPVLARLVPDLKDLEAIRLPVSGRIAASVDLDGAVHSLAFDLTGGTGEIRLGGPIEHAWAVAGARLKGRSEPDLRRITVEELSLDLGGPSLTAQAIVTQAEASLAVAGSATALNVPVDSLDSLWPAPLAVHARKWLTENLKDGLVTEATARFEAERNEGDEAPALRRLDGTIAFEKTSVHYLRPMPPVERVSGRADFTARGFDIAVTGGQLGDLRVPGGTVRIFGLEKSDEAIDLDIEVQGPVRSALKILDHPRLGLLKTVDIRPDSVEGVAATRLKIAFPLLKDLTFDHVTVTAESDVKGAAMPGVALGLPLSAGDFALKVDTKALDLRGTARLGTIPASIEWRENFSRKAPFRSRYRLRGALTTDQRRSVGLDVAPFIPPFLDETVDAEVTYTVVDGRRAQLTAQLDLGPARMAIPWLDWSKPPGHDGRARIGARLEKGKLVAVGGFRVDAAGLVASGSVTFSDGGTRLETATLDRFTVGDTDMRGALAVQADGTLDISVQGAGFDATPLLEGTGEQGGLWSSHGDEDDLPNFTLTAEIDRLKVGAGRFLEGVHARAVHHDDRWRTLLLSGRAVEGETSGSLDVLLRPVDGVRRLSVKGSDAGLVLRTLGIFETVNGGKLDISGAIDDAAPERPLAGRAEITDFKVVNAPVLAQLLNVAGITGILDVLRGEGISFARLDAPFVLKDSVLQFQDARAYGASLGLTAKGYIDLGTDAADLEGTLVPAYAFNSLLGNVPVLGNLLTGDKGGGVFAATYRVKGKLDAPEITVNPLSVLAPGFLRNLFGIFQGAPQDPSKTTPKPGDAPPVAAPSSGTE